MNKINQDDFLDALTMVAFLIGLANYRENVGQSDMQSAIDKAITQVNDSFSRQEEHLRVQDEHLKKQDELIEAILKGDVKT